MIGTRENPAASSALRIPATRPSIMSLGATMSMPARACVTATLPSRYTDASLSTSPSCTTPQCPWSVYSHRQASPITSTSGAARFTARAACCTIPCSSYASEPVASLAAGRPKRMMPPSPSRRARRPGLPLVDLGRRRDLHRAVLRGHSPVQPAPRSPLPAPAVGRHRRLTSTLERGEEAPLRRDLARARWILERREGAAGLAVVCADLEAERSLTRRRHDVQRIEPRGDLPCELEPLEPRPRKERRVQAITPFLHLLHPRRHVAAQRHDVEVGPEVSDLRDTAQTGRAELGACGKAGDRRDPGLARDQRLGGIGPLRHRRQHQAGWEGGRQIFERVYRHVDATVAERLLELFRKEALPLELVQRAIDLRIATRLDDHELGVHAAPRERGLHPLGLPPCELAPPCAQLERSDHPSLVPRPSSP